MKRLIRKLFNWFFLKELEKLKEDLKKSSILIAKLEKQERIFSNILQNIDISVDVDVDKYSKSWAVISLQGENSDFIKFIDLGYSDINDIKRFLNNYDRISNIKIDCSPRASQFLKIKRKS